MSTIPNRFLRDGRGLPSNLEEERIRIEGLARSYGLDFFETIFEMCTYEEINMLAAYGGFPTRYPHWRFGMDFLETNKSYEYGLSKIYEMVINTDPAYAYLMDCNLDVDQKLVMAHVFGHVDFFKNNAWFRHTNRKMLDQMANHATRVRNFMARHGVDEVERTIDLALSLDNLVDPYRDHIARPKDEEVIDDLPSDAAARLPAKAYMDRYVNPPEWLDAQRQRAERETADQRFPEHPERDVLAFVIEHARMPAWKAEILHIVHDEAMYFAPQAQTKIMNEGWATYWHTHLMTRHVLTDGDVVDYCDHHSGTTAQQPGRLNPYKLGVELWRHIERRWDRGQFGKDWLEETSPEARRQWDTHAHLGRKKLFEVRSTHNDVTFLDAFLTEDFCREQGFFTQKYDAKSQSWELASEEFADVKKGLLSMLASRGTPRISVVDGNGLNQGVLCLAHDHEGPDLDLNYATTVLGNLAALWGRPVHLATQLDAKPVRLVHDGANLSRVDGP